MIARFENIVAAALLAGLPLALSPAAAIAQDAEPEPIEQEAVEQEALEQEALQCVATADPAELQAGQPAIQVTASLSEDIGTVAGFQAPVESGLGLADPADIPRAELAAEEEVRPIEMTPETNTVSFWLTTAQTAPGTYEAEVTSEEGSCTVTLTVIE